MTTRFVPVEDEQIDSFEHDQAKNKNTLSKTLYDLKLLRSKIEVPRDVRDSKVP